MAKILTEQKKRIQATQKKKDNELLRGGGFLFPEQRAQYELELRQLQSNRKFWEKRLLALEAEATREPERIREQYEVRAVRLEPVGLVYLYPEQG